MGVNLFLGCGMMVICLVLQCVMVRLLLHGLFVLEARQILHFTLIQDMVLLIMVMLILFAGNLLQVTLWSSLFLSLTEIKNFQTAFYFSMVNFTTLGYGDVLIHKDYRLLGAFEAANGILMLGLSTSVLFTVLNAMIRRSWRGLRDPQASASRPDASTTGSVSGER